MSHLTFWRSLRSSILRLVSGDMYMCLKSEESSIVWPSRLDKLN